MGNPEEKKSTCDQSWPQTKQSFELLRNTQANCFFSPANSCFPFVHSVISRGKKERDGLSEKNIPCFPQSRVCCSIFLMALSRRPQCSLKFIVARQSPNRLLCSAISFLINTFGLAPQVPKHIVSFSLQKVLSPNKPPELLRTTEDYIACKPVPS